MALVNGTHATDRVNTTPAQLGKRKRSISPQDDSKTAPGGEAKTTEWLDAVLRTIQEHDFGKELLAYQLSSSRVKEGPTSKRRRTQSTSHTTESIRTRIDNESYQSLEQLLGDLEKIRESISSQMNGHDDPHPLESTNVDEIRDLILQKHRKHADAGISSEGLDEIDNDNHPALQLLSLRGQTDSGVRQLFTGLPLSQLDDSKDADTKRLPNGFEFIDSALIDASTSKAKDNRTFGEVFTSHRSLKPLDPPRPFREQANELDFVPALSKLGPSSKLDYRAVALNTGMWLAYATEHQQRLGTDSIKPTKIANKANSLFKAAYSSFAPSVDHSTSIVTESDRARKWFVQNEMILPFNEAASPAALSQSQEDSIVEDDHLELADNLDDIIQNYVSEADIDGCDEGDKILNEVNELIQILSSYQTIRDLDHVRGPGSIAKPTQPELDTYELLQTQLQVMINTLPPHAVAKLNGDQLDALNIRTTVPVTIPDIAGTAQADNFTLRKQRAGQGANSIAGRGQMGTSTRPAYGTPNPMYAGATPNYAQNASAAAAYGARPVNNMYTTPRAGMPSQTPQYTQQPYRAPNTPYVTPGAQSYQQTIGNKYKPPYIPQPATNNQQQRAPDRVSSWQRPDSPQKPLVNGQTPQQMQTRAFAGLQTPSFSDSSAQSNTLMQQKLLEQMKQTQSTTSQ